MSFIVRLLSRFMAWEIHRTLHNFLPCLTFMLFRTCNKKKIPVYANYGYLSSVENDSETADTAIHTKYLSNWETEQNTAHCLVFLTKCIQLSLKCHIFGYIVILPREVQIGGNTKTKILIRRKLFANKILQAPEWHRLKTNWRVDTILIKIQVHEIIM